MNDNGKDNDCYHCGFYDWDSEGCTCPHSDRWYAGACATATEEDFMDATEVIDNG